MMYGLYDNYGGWGPGNMMGFIGGGLMMIVFWVLIVIFVVWVVREITGRNARRRDDSSSKALDILKERYAKGEIDKREFEEKKKDLSIN